MKPEVKLTPSLSLFQVVYLGLAWMTPMIYFTTYGIAFDHAHGMMTQAYLLAFIAIFFTARSYGIMSRVYPASGSAYTYTAKSIHPKLGFLVGWALLLDYLFSPLIAYLTFGIFLHAQFPAIPAYLWILFINLLIAAVNVIGVQFSAKLSQVFVLLQIVFIALFCAILIVRLTEGGLHAPLHPLLQTDVPLSVILSGASLICFSFLGFDSITTMSEETKDAGRTLPRAIMIIIGVACLLYLSASYLTQLAFPQLALAVSDSAGFEIVKLVGGAGLSALFVTVLIGAIFTQGLSSLTTVSRLLYVMGRDSVLPKRVFGYLHPKYKTPVTNILVVSAFSLLALIIDLDTAVKFVNFGALSAFIFVNLSVIAKCYIRDRQRSPMQTVRYLILPLVGAAIVFKLLTMLDATALLTGLAWVLFGGVYYLLRSRRQLQTRVVLPAVQTD